MNKAELKERPKGEEVWRFFGDLGFYLELRWEVDLVPSKFIGA